MTKKRSISLFVIFSIILVVALVASFANFTYPLRVNGKYYSYSSFVENIKLGDDVSPSLRILYRAELPDQENLSEESIKREYESHRESTINSLREIVISEGYRDVTVRAYGDDSIEVNVGNILTRDDEQALVDLIGNPATINFSTSSDVKESFASAKHVDDVFAGSQFDNATGKTAHIVTVKFKNEYKDYIKEKTSNGGTLYVFLGETQLASINMSGASGSAGITDGQVSFAIAGNDDYEPTLADAVRYANRIKTGTLDLELREIDTGMISASYGSNANIMISIAMMIFVVAAFAFLIVKYKHGGLLSCFSLLFFWVIGLFLLQSIPWVHINFAGLIGIIVMFTLSVDSLIMILEKAKSYYNSDTKLHIAFKTAQKDCLAKILISNLSLLVLGFILVFMPNLSIQSLGWTLLILSIVTLFTSLALTRLFIKMYLSINSKDGKKFNFHKGGKNA